MKLSQGDTVVVLTGKDKGKKGTVMRVLRDQNRVIVSGVNMATKHIKKTPQAPGRTLKLEVSLHASNVAALDPKSGKPTRIGYTVDAKTGKKTRIAKKSGVELVRTKMVAAAKGEDKAAAPSKKSPFWKKAGFGANAAAEGEAGKSETAPTNHPTTVAHTRSAGRGS